jgi:nucleoside-diphosphate-sugar epimerase
MSNNRITIIGSNGFLGSNLSASLSHTPLDIFSPTRSDLAALKGDLGVVVYTAGFGICSSLSDLTKVVDANINVLSRILNNCSFSKFIYISSTRLYMGLDTSEEESNLCISFSDNRKAFNLSKLIAEELCLSLDNTYVIRPSNIYGPAINSSLFLPTIVRHAILNGHIDMYVPESYEKDYVSVSDVVGVITDLIVKDRPTYQIYNVGSGVNTSALEIANLIQSRLKCTIAWCENSTNDIFPVTNIDRLKEEFLFSPSSVLSDLDSMITDFIAAHRNGMF